MRTEVIKQAFESSIEGPEDEPYIFQTLRCLLRLYELDPDSVTIQFPHEIGEDFIRFVFEEIGINDQDEYETFPCILELNTRCTHNQKSAAEFCGTSVRSLQRWSQKGLFSVKYKGQVFYDEDDLVDFMDKIGHHPGTQRVGRYGHRVKG